jgi:hypothetical protein
MAIEEIFLTIKEKHHGKHHAAFSLPPWFTLIRVIWSFTIIPRVSAAHKLGTLKRAVTA